MKGIRMVVKVEDDGRLYTDKGEGVFVWDVGSLKKYGHGIIKVGAEAMKNQ